MARVWQRLRRARWGETLTVAAALLGAGAAIGGLIFTAVATYFSAAVSQDQLKQSKEDADLALRRQALRVSIWQEVNGGALIVHVLNGSPDPVYRVTVVFTLYDGGKSEESYFLQESIAPCTELQYEEKRLGAGNRVFGKAKAFRDLRGWSLDSVTFSDRDGRSWMRQETELHRWGPGDLGENFSNVTYGGVPKVKPAVACE